MDTLRIYQEYKFKKYQYRLEITISFGIKI